jgi:hypothetical protein
MKNVESHIYFFSENIPLSCSFIGGHDLVGSSSDVWVLVVVELLQSVVNSVFQSGWTAVTDNVQDSLPDSDVLVFSHFKNSFPEFVNVFQNFAWAKLFTGFKSHIIVLMMGILKNLFNVFGITTNIDEFLLAWEVFL